MPTSSGLPYNLHVPVDGDLADVPADFGTLATTITTALNGKLQRSDLTPPGGSKIDGADTLYQTKIKIVTAVPASGAGYAEGDIIFVVAP